jgi:hypothetical protein
VGIINRWFMLDVNEDLSRCGYHKQMVYVGDVNAVLSRFGHHKQVVYIGCKCRAEPVWPS